jgi:hypothetical protein
MGASAVGASAPEAIDTLKTAATTPAANVDNLEYIVPDFIALLVG